MAFQNVTLMITPPMRTEYALMNAPTSDINSMSLPILHPTMFKSWRKQLSLPLTTMIHMCW